MWILLLQYEYNLSDYFAEYSNQWKAHTRIYNEGINIAIVLDDMCVGLINVFIAAYYIILQLDLTNLIYSGEFIIDNETARSSCGCV